MRRAKSVAPPHQRTIIGLIWFPPLAETALTGATVDPAQAPPLSDPRPVLCIHRPVGVGFLTRGRAMSQAQASTVLEAPPAVRAKEKRKASPGFKAFAGSLGGLIEACCLQPIDTIKTRMQLNPLRYPGILTTGMTIGREEGVRSLWKGLTPFATHLYCKYALRFGTNAFFQSVLADKDGKLDTSRRVLAGLGAGVAEALIIVTPFEVVKIRLQNQFGLDKSKLKYTGPIDAAIKTVKNEVRRHFRVVPWAYITRCQTAADPGRARRVCWRCGRGPRQQSSGMGSTRVSLVVRL
jgi:hypothetical protein